MIDHHHATRSLAPVHPPVTHTQLWAACVHEAGHAIACIVAGWELQSVEVAVVWEGKQFRIGLTKPAIDHLRTPDARGRLDFPTNYNFRRSYCCYTLAGPVAEFELLPEPPEKPCSDDVKYALRDAAAVFPGDPTYQRKFYVLCGLQARELIRCYAPEVRTLAQALLRHGRLTGDQINHVLLRS